MDESLIRDLESAIADPVKSASAVSEEARPSEEIIARSEKLAPDVIDPLTSAQRNALIGSLQSSAERTKRSRGFEQSLYMRVSATAPTAKVLIRMGIARSTDDHRSIHQEERHCRFGWGVHAVLTPLGEEVAFKLFADRYSDSEVEEISEERDRRLAEIRSNRELRAEEIKEAFERLRIMKALSEGAEYPVYSKTVSAGDSEYFTSELERSFNRSIESNGRMASNLRATDEMIYQIITSAYRLGRRDAERGEDRIAQSIAAEDSAG